MSKLNHLFTQTLEAVTIAGEVKQRERFQPIIQGLLIRNNEPLRVACLTLINALISSPDNLDFRVHLCNEFMWDGLIDVLEALENDKGEDLQTQLSSKCSMNTRRRILTNILKGSTIFGWSWTM